MGGGPGDGRLADWGPVARYRARCGDEVPPFAAAADAFAASAGSAVVVGSLADAIRRVRGARGSALAGGVEGGLVLLVGGGGCVPPPGGGRWVPLPGGGGLVLLVGGGGCVPPPGGGGCVALPDEGRFVPLPGGAGPVPPPGGSGCVPLPGGGRFVPLPGGAGPVPPPGGGGCVPLSGGGCVSGGSVSGGSTALGRRSAAPAVRRPPGSSRPFPATPLDDPRSQPGCGSWLMTQSPPRAGE